MPRPFLRTLFPFVAAGLTTLAGIFPASDASALSPYLVVPAPSVAEASAAYKYANMTETEALSELDRRKVPYKVADPIDGVTTPVRLTGKLHGVYIHSSIPESQRATSVYEVLDARLALALDDFAKILSRHDIEEVVHYSLYRPNVPREDHDLKETKVAAKTGAPSVKPATTGARETPSAGAKDAAPKTSKVVAPPVKQVPPGAPKTKPSALKAPALPALPAGKLFSGAPSKGALAPSSRAKQKAPGAGDKSSAGAAPAAKPAQEKAPSAAPATKPGPQSAATRPAKATAGRGIGARAALTSPKTTSTPARPRAGAVTKPEASKTETPKNRSAKTELKAAPKPAVSPAPSEPATRAPATRQTWAAPGTRHPAGLAIDVAMLKKRDGQWISVATHFRGRIGDKTCGDSVREGDTPEARELRSIVCESNDLGVFTYVLTPNYNAAHFDHFHMEIRPQVKWFLYH